MSEDEIIQFLADRYKTSIAEVRKATNSQFKFAKQQMESEKMPSIRLPFFGIFKLNKRKLKYIQKHQNDKK